MIKVTDEMLMAYGDGELDTATSEKVRTAIKADKDLQTRLARMKAVDELLKAAIQTDLSIPARIHSALNGDPSAAQNVVPLKPVQSRIGKWLPTGVGIAAALMIVIGGNIMSPASMSWLQQVEDGIALAGPVQAAIISAPSGKHIQHKGLNIMPIVSFVSADGRLCREAQLDDQDLAARIIACRDIAEDEWCIEAFARMPSVPQKNAYQAASVPKDPVIDAAYARLGIKSTLDVQAELAAIKNGWKHK